VLQDPGLSRSERRLRHGIAAAALLSCALLASAGPVSAAAARTLLELPCDLRAGELVEIRWGPPAARVEETELVLSTDAGRHYSLHISPELDPRACRFLWRVPNLPGASGAAHRRPRLRARVGRIFAVPDHGRPEAAARTLRGLRRRSVGSARADEPIA